MASDEKDPSRPPAASAPDPQHSARRRSTWSMLARTVQVIVIVFMVEILFFGLYIVAAFGGLIVAVIAPVSALRRREPLMVLAMKVLFPVLMVLMAVGTNIGNNVLARSRAARVIAACERFHGQKGRFPDRLEELVPRYLRSVPRAKLTPLMFNRFKYLAEKGRHQLMYVEHPPFGRVSYTFETKGWSRLD